MQAQKVATFFFWLQLYLRRDVGVAFAYFQNPEFGELSGLIWC